MQEDPPAQRAEQPTPAQDTEPDTEAPPKRNHHAGHGLPENLPNLPFPFAKATCRFGATEPTESGRTQHPLQPIVAFGTVKDLFDAVETKGLTNLRYANRYPRAKAARRRVLTDPRLRHRGERYARPGACGTRGRPPHPLRRGLQAPTTRRSSATP